MTNVNLVEAADEALIMLRRMSDAELFEALEACEPTLAYAITGDYGEVFYSSSVMNSRLVATSMIDRELLTRLSQHLGKTTVFDAVTAMNDSHYALAA